MSAGSTGLAGWQESVRAEQLFEDKLGWSVTNQEEAAEAVATAIQRWPTLPRAAQLRLPGQGLLCLPFMDMLV